MSPTVLLGERTRRNYERTRKHAYESRFQLQPKVPFSGMAVLLAVRSNLWRFACHTSWPSCCCSDLLRSPSCRTNTR